MSEIQLVERAGVAMTVGGQRRQEGTRSGGVASGRVGSENEHRVDWFGWHQEELVRTDASTGPKTTRVKRTRLVR